MLNQYPQDIRLWIRAKGGVEKMTFYAMWKLVASSPRRASMAQTATPTPTLSPKGRLTMSLTCAALH
jgi:hypothetical protein